MPARSGVTRRHGLGLAAVLAASLGSTRRALAGLLGPGPDRITKPVPIGPGRSVPVIFRKALPPQTPRVRYPGFKPGAEVLKSGTIRRPGALPLSCDIVFERDVAVVLPDGRTLYTDVFRPVGEGRWPAIIGYSPYGKAIGGQHLDDLPGRSGVPLSAVSELQRFEGADPAYWVQHGYCVVNVDPPGAYMSDGDIDHWGYRLARDGHDVVEWCARQSWCDGKVALSGNSWLAISQWFIAATRPPHLTCIAPWEGLTDVYRDVMARGGIPMPQRRELIMETLGGRNYIEDVAAMISAQPLMNDYWRSKVAPLSRIEVPAYVVAGYNNIGHAHGSFDAFRQMASKDKWLRVHNTDEWADYYDPKRRDDLRRFFDHFMKGIDNGWEATPRVRVSVLDPGHEDIVDRVEADWPLPQTQFRKLFLTEDGAMSLEAPQAASQVGYSAEDGKLTFLHRCEADLEITGYMNLYLWVEAQGADDMDIVVTVGKQDGPAAPPQSRSFKASGYLRVSHRRTDPKLSTPSEPWLPHLKEERLNPGEVVLAQVPIWPLGLRLHAGEALELTVAAYRQARLGPYPFGKAKIPVPVGPATYDPAHPPAFTALGGQPDPSALALSVNPPPPRNKGRHLIKLGGERASYLLIPMIPA